LGQPPCIVVEIDIQWTLALHFWVFGRCKILLLQLPEQLGQHIRPMNPNNKVVNFSDRALLHPLIVRYAGNNLSLNEGFFKGFGIFSKE
jgi:hypothetical protein